MALVRSNRGAPGIDGVTFEVIEAGIGKDAYLAPLREELEVRRTARTACAGSWIPKPDGSERPLGIPTIRDRVVQMAVKLVVEPIFEADFCEHSYGFRPQRSAHDAVDAVADGLVSRGNAGHRCGCVELLRHDSPRQAHGRGGRTHGRWCHPGAHPTMAQGPGHRRG